MSKTNKSNARKPVAKSAKTSAKKPTRVIQKFQDNQRIIVLPAGKENPRREGSAPFKRYEALRKSRTVGAFLKVQPKWRATIARAVRENLIRVA